MADSTAEAALKALFDALSAQMPLDATLTRNTALPLRVPEGGLAILRDGDPGDPEITMSPLRYEYDHAAELDIHADGDTPEARDAIFDALKQAVAQGIAADRTLGGVVDDLRAQAPKALLINTDGDQGATPIKAATIPVILTYVTSDPLT